MKNRTVQGVLIIFLFITCLYGISLMLSPALTAHKLETGIRQSATAWQQENAAPEAPAYPALLEDMRAFNESLLRNGQSNLDNELAYQEEIFDLSSYGISDDIVGVISIPRIDIELPLYLGATERNLAKGFAQLSYTSMPIGGKGTHSVIACHRGYRGAAYLRDADRLTPGDTIYLENHWDTLLYEIRSTEVVLPYDIDSIFIQPGKDLLTLVTCTPYRIGTHRLLLHCERIYLEGENL